MKMQKIRHTDEDFTCSGLRLKIFEAFLCSSPIVSCSKENNNNNKDFESCSKLDCVRSTMLVHSFLLLLYFLSFHLHCGGREFKQM